MFSCRVCAALCCASRFALMAAMSAGESGASPAPPLPFPAPRVAASAPPSSPGAGQLRSVVAWGHPSASRRRPPRSRGA